MDSRLPFSALVGIHLIKKRDCTLVWLPVDSNPPISASRVDGHLSCLNDGCHCPKRVSMAPTPDPACTQLCCSNSFSGQKRRAWLPQESPGFNKRSLHHTSQTTVPIKTCASAVCSMRPIDTEGRSSCQAFQRLLRLPLLARYAC